MRKKKIYKKHIIKACLVCGKSFKTYYSKIKTGRGKYCCKNCKNKSQIGKPTWNKGKKWSEKAKRKMSEAKMGKIGYWRGKKRPKVSRRNLGNTYSLGKKRSLETKKKMSKIHKGKKLSIITKEKIGRASRLFMKRKWENKKFREKRIESIVKSLWRRPTSLEKDMIKIIKKNNLPYRYVGDGSFLIGYKNPDFININGEKKLIEVGNTFHHNKNYPKERAEYFTKWGWESYIFRTNKLNEEIIKTRGRNLYMGTAYYKS